MTPKPGDLPKVTAPRVPLAGPQPGCAPACLSRCTKIAGEMPAGTLKKVGGSPPTQTGREKVGVGWGGGGLLGVWGMVWAQALKPGTAPAWPPRCDHRED